MEQFVSTLFSCGLYSQFSTTPHRRVTYWWNPDEGRFKDDNMEGQGTMKMSRNVIIPSHSEDEESGEDPKADKSPKDGTPKNDWMIPIEFQSDISHIHQRAGFTQVGL
jgi:hypothetical protein